MKKIQFFIGMRTWYKSSIFITPSLYFGLNKFHHEEIHYCKIEFQWIIFGFGIKLNWKNKKYEITDFNSKYLDSL